VLHVRIVILALFVKLLHMARIPTPSIGDVTMGIRKQFGDMRWTIDGLSLTTLTSYGYSIVTSMLKHVVASSL
jgi:hypothetical protein